MVNLKIKPFNLSDEDIRWVEETKAAMSLDEKIGQLFCPIGLDKSAGYLESQLLKYHIGGIMYRAAPSAEAQECHRYLQEHSKIPLLISANLEAGGDGAAADGTAFGEQMQAAAGDKIHAYRLGKICAREGKAIGVNWSFAPVADIDLNWRNPITNVRTYGDSAETVLEYALEYKRAADEEGLAVAVKHFPGDGVDEVDQHLLTSVNTMSCDEWDKSYGKIYKSLIDDGALSVMVGHIAMPAYQKAINPSLSDKLVPASLSKELLMGLLREKLGFNGLISTDATPMAGFTSAMKRELAVPMSIACGCDVFLFNVELDEDFELMKKGFESGIITEERIDDALSRILGMKAALGLHKKAKTEIVPKPDALSAISCGEHLKWAEECADKAVTLVKDREKILPISPAKTPRVLLQILGDFPSNARVSDTAEGLLKAEGFEVVRYVPETPQDIMSGSSVAKFKQSYDLVIYLGNVENASNKTTNRINWHTMFGKGNNIPWFVDEVPTVFVSLANPYHLVDVPMIGTYINCYSNHDTMIKAVFSKLFGKSEFKGKSPVDPFCGKDFLKF